MTTLLEAASSFTITDAAHTYLLAGASIIPLTGKKPSIVWRRYTHERASQFTAKYWLRSGKMSNIGLVCGAVSGGLVVIDVDSIGACAEFEAAFPDLTHTLTIRSGSGRGKHYYYYAADIIPANTWRNGVELRSNGAYVVAPPSRHVSSGLAWCVVRGADVLRTNRLVEVWRWISERALPAPALPTPSGAPVVSKSAYGRNALADEAGKVRGAAEGTANATLYRAALKMGSLIASGLLTQGEVESALELAAAELTRRDGIQATRRTIASGLRIGMGSPRTVK